MSDPTPALVYKLLTADEMAALERDGSFAGSADDRRDGFIHLSTAGQLEGTLAKHFGDRDGLHLAAVDVEALGDALRWEASRDGADYPHLYGALSLETVTAYSPLERDDGGTLRLPVAG